MDQVVTFGLDIAKSVFQAHGVNAAGEVIVRQRLTPKVAAVALANKNARMVWALMTSGERYRDPVAA